MKARRTIVGSMIAAAALLGAALLAGGGTLSSADGVAKAAATAAPTNTGRPAISGTAQVGQTLTATPGTWSGTPPITFAYQWQRCNASGSSCGNIVGATTSTYTPVNADVGSTVSIGVTAANTDGSSTAYSDADGPVAALGSPPAPTSQPSLTGTAKEDDTLTVSAGTWTGTAPIRLSYQWQRCDTSGKACSLIQGATGTSYRLVAADVGHRLLVAVVAGNGYGAQTAFTAPSAVVSGRAPEATRGPVIAGTAIAGQTLTVSNGTWTGATPIAFAYQWQRCDTAGNNCGSISGATRQTYKVTTADNSHSLVALVTAKNTYGAKSVRSAFRNVVGTGSAPAPAPPQPSPTRTVAVASVSLPNRLVISGVAFTPRVLTGSTGSFSARFRVTDSSGRPVTGALVYAIALPYGRVANAPEVQTDANGYATINLHRAARFSVRRGYIVFFVRARKPGGDLLGGVSTRRLVQVTTRA